MNVLKWNAVFACFLIIVGFLDILLSADISFTKYQYGIQMSGYRCGSAQTVFEMDTVLDSLTCGKLCHHNKKCQSFFYQPDSHMCIGCSFLWRWFHSKDCLHGSQFFFKRPTTFTKPRECYDVGFAHFYRGHQSKTHTGRQCQNWDAKTPHEPRFIYLSPHNFPDNSVKDAKNYCRDPDGDGKPWCFTTDPASRWEYCDIPQCSANRDCYKEEYAWQYQGKTNVTKGKLECQRWEHFSNTIEWTEDFKLPESSLSEANNYCRDPQRFDQPWCYTDANKNWDFCDIKQCPKDYCYEDVSRNYQGQMSITETGTECQRWDSTYPHKHSYGSMASKFPDKSVSDAVNYCRDPSSSGRPWCYTTDAEKKWDWCAVWKCENRSDENRFYCN